MMNLDLMKKRLNYYGGNQEERMIKDKYKTFLKTLNYSYQSAEVINITQNSKTTQKALINPHKQTMDYDNKIISIDYNYNYKMGDIFKWVGTNSYWIMYLQELTEDAYMRAHIRRCRYKIYWIDYEEEVPHRKKSSFAYVRGPVETKIKESLSKKGSVDLSNNSLEIILPFNKDTLKAFKRYSRFAFNEKVWEVQVMDDISTDGIIQVIAVEDSVNRVTDDVKEEKVTDCFYVAPVVPDDNKKSEIQGKEFIKPAGWFSFSVNEEKHGGKWFIKEKNRPVVLNIKNSYEIQLQWEKMCSGQFTLCYSIEEETYEKIIVVESLF